MEKNDLKEKINDAFYWIFYRFQLDELENEIVKSFALKKSQQAHLAETDLIYDKAELLNYLSISLGFGENGLDYRFLKRNKFTNTDILYRYLKAHKLLVERFFIERAFLEEKNENTYFGYLKDNLPLIKEMIKEKIDTSKKGTPN